MADENNSKLNPVVLSIPFLWNNEFDLGFWEELYTVYSREMGISRCFRRSERELILALYPLKFKNVIKSFAIAFPCSKSGKEKVKKKLYRECSWNTCSLSQHVSQNTINRPKITSSVHDFVNIALKEVNFYYRALLIKNAEKIRPERLSYWKKRKAVFFLKEGMEGQTRQSFYVQIHPNLFVLGIHEIPLDLF